MKVLAFIEDADPSDVHLFVSIEDFIQFLKEDRRYEFPFDAEDREVLAKLQQGQDVCLAAYSYRWIEVQGKPKIVTPSLPRNAMDDVNGKYVYWLVNTVTNRIEDAADDVIWNVAGSNYRVMKNPAKGDKP